MESIRDHLERYQHNGVFKETYQKLIAQMMMDEDVKEFLKEHESELNEQIIANSYSKLYEFIKEKERIQIKGHSQNPGFAPKLMLNVGYIDVVYQATDEFLLQEEQRQVAKRIQTLEMPKGIAELRLSPNFLDAGKGRINAVKYIVEFCKAYQDNPRAEHKGAYLYGTYGIGKTHLLGCLAGELASKGYSSYLVHFPSLVVELKEAIAKNKVNEKLDIIKKASILMIDDIGGESLSAWIRDDVLMVILDYRMRQHLPTFFTSNLDFDSLVEHLKGTSVEDERKSQRLMERIKVLAKPMEMRGANRRDE
ncbi:MULTISPECIES: primosomal protein DnaI [unclassified Granulicatella]|uniref:primosomal protein DnaI n=1 Tax=unclassified Granulicatella TaxID=2630493 RepID=UPI0010734DF7|nr:MULTISPECIES: primosomal protein DnaI [unclassified Granulicatella]MBF0779684.1 primosomal protein DnaI [Granulicatella sp. 19428wC4_WM01]TFU96338.1 primosomal protein DnaI [Granulicatella sp. WM01]